MNLYSFAALWLRTIAINAPLSSRVSSKRYEVYAVSSQNLSKRNLIPDLLAEIEGCACWRFGPTNPQLGPRGVKRRMLILSTSILDTLPWLISRDSKKFSKVFKLKTIATFSDWIFATISCCMTVDRHRFYFPVFPNQVHAAPLIVILKQPICFSGNHAWSDVAWYDLIKVFC